jgi:pyrroloquinoline quinone biosynthesis protein E
MNKIQTITPMDSEPHRRMMRMLPMPEPAAGNDYYKRERELSIEFDPRRTENFNRYLRWKKEGGAVDFLPIKLDIENVSRCNFRCQMCVVSDWEKGKRADDMSIETFKHLLDEQYGLIEIKLQGIGEPLMMGDSFFDMIRYARSRKIWVRSTTNASLLHLKDNFKKVIDTDINELQISIDGADRETFEKIRRGSVFDRVAANCKLVNQYCRDQGVDRTKMWTVVQRDNEHQLEQFVDIAHELGFTNQVFMVNLIDWGMDTWHERNSRITVENHLDPERLFALIARGEKLGVRVRFWSASDKYSAQRRETLCPWPFERAYISSDMRVVPCCMIGNPDVYEIGNGLGNSHSLTEVWQSSAYETFRQAHLTGDIPQVCRNCYHLEEHWGDAPKASGALASS